MIQITCTFTENGETKIKYSDGFSAQMGVTRADMLKDIIYEITEEYNKTLDEGLGSFKSKSSD